MSAVASSPVTFTDRSCHTGASDRGSNKISRPADSAGGDSEHSSELTATTAFAG